MEGASENMHTDITDHHEGIRDNVKTFLRGGRNLAELIDAMPGGIVIFHVENDGFILDYANEAWFAMHYLNENDRGQYLGPKVLSIVAEGDRDAVRAEYRRIAQYEGATGNVTYRVCSPDGETHWIDMTFKYAFAEEGHRYYYASYSNLDEQIQAAELVRENRKVLQDMVENSDIQFFTYYPEDHVCKIFELNDRLALLPTSWDNFPDTFLKYTQLSDGDARSYRTMVEKIDNGADEAGCTVRFRYQGIWIWERVRLRAIRDRQGRTIRAQGYSINVTDRIAAEDKLRQERYRLKSLEGDVFEAFSFNLSKNSQPNIQTSDAAMLEGEVSDELFAEALRIAPALDHANPDTREILLRAAQRIPDAEARKKFITTCSADAMRHAVNDGSFSAQLQYRRYVGDVIRWVSSSAEVLPDPASGDLIAFFYTRDVNDKVVDSLLSDRLIQANYRTVALYDLQTGLAHVKATTGPLSAGYDGKRYGWAIENASEQAVMPDEAEEFRAKFASETVIAQLEKMGNYTAYFTIQDRAEDLPCKPHRRMKSDMFFLDENKDTIVVLLSDVTEIFEQERDTREKMSQALSAAEQASVAKTEFLSRMSHEIRTPMNAIIGLDAIALQEQDISTAMEDHLQKIGISARFLLSLINDILDMSRIESGRMMLKNEPFDFEDLINGINTILYEQCRDNNLEYECVLKSFTEETYVGDATKLQQVLVNILGNAVKFTPPGGKIHLMIEQIDRTKNHARLRFEVSDTGIGVDDEFLPYLFEPFSQEDRGRTSVYGGSGLGLAISKNIVGLMGGEISVHSIKNVGSEFTIEVELGLTEQTIRRRAALTTNLRNLATLIVDDDIIICQHTQMILKDAGFAAEWVDSGTSALRTIEKRHGEHRDFDLVLLDWKMPDMDGIETARKIRQVVGSEVTIIIMTAYDWTDIEKKAKAAGVDMFMKKPVFASSVTRAVELIFSQKQSFEEPSKELDYDFTGRRVLLVEDNDLNAEIAKSILTMRNCEVDVAGNGAEAVESFASAREGYYDAVLMDVRMPIMDGLEATRIIRAMRKPDSKTVPIIAMTANAFQEDVNQSLACGMSAHLAKPIEPPTLYATLHRFFDKVDKAGS